VTDNRDICECEAGNICTKLVRRGGSQLASLEVRELGYSPSVASIELSLDEVRRLRDRLLDIEALLEEEAGK
jgi:hypothetical protein